MSKIKIATKMKAGQKHTGKVEEVKDDSVVFALQDNSSLLVPLPYHMCEYIDNNHDDEIITLSLDADGNYEIEEHESWPEEKTK